MCRNTFSSKCDLIFFQRERTQLAFRFQSVLTAQLSHVRELPSAEPSNHCCRILQRRGGDTLCATNGAISWVALNSNRDTAVAFAKVSKTRVAHLTLAWSYTLNSVAYSRRGCCCNDSIHGRSRGFVLAFRRWWCGIPRGTNLYWRQRRLTISSTESR